MFSTMFSTTIPGRSLKQTVKPSDLNPKAAAWLECVLDQCEVGEDDVDQYCQLVNAAELLSRAEELKADIRHKGLWVTVMTGNGASMKINPSIAAEKAVRGQFSTVCKQLDLV